MTSRRRYWIRIVLANGAAALAVAAITSTLAAGNFGRELRYSLVYANTIGTLMGVVIPRVANRYWHRENRVRWAFLLTAMVALTAVGTLLATLLLFALGMVSSRFFWPTVVGSFRVGIVIALIIGIAVTVYETIRSDLDETTAALRTKQRDEADARRLASEARLASLESRVQPHFLFNTLNSIAELIHNDPAGAERMTGQLASLLRSSLDEEPGRLIALRDELAVVRDYLDIERVRFGDRLTFEMAVDEAMGAVLVPRLAVQTLVENSIKHAATRRREGIRLAIRAAPDNGRVHVEVEDNGPGFDPASLPEGHGLALLGSRLALAFGDRAALRIDSRAGRTCVTIELPA